MKILQLIQRNQLRGAEIFAAQLSEELQNQGNEVMIISLFEGNAQLPFNGKQVCLQANSKSRFWNKSAWKKLANVIQEFQPDIVQANAGDTLKYAAFSRMLLGWKAKLIFRNANFISGFVDSFPKKLFNQFLLKQVAGVASVSALCSEDFKKTFRFPENKIKVLPIGVLEVKANPSLPEDINGLLGNSDFLIHIGSFVPEKNHKELFSIFDYVILKYPKLKLLLIGEGKLKSKYQKQFAGRPEVVFLGSRTDVDAILPFAKALLLPSMIEGLPGVILEAMNCSIPVISYDVGGVSEVLLPGKTGWLIPFGDKEKFVEAIEEVLSMTEDLKLNLLTNAKELIEEHYQISMVAKKFEAFYTKVLNILN